MKLFKTTYSNISDLVKDSERDFVREASGGTIGGLFAEKEAEGSLILFESCAGGETVGYISLFSSPDFMAIGPMFVSDEFRGKGYGKKQVGLVIEYCRGNGVNKIKTKTWSTNAASQKIFEDLGFALEKTTAGFREDGSDTVHYILNLDK